MNFFITNREIKITKGVECVNPSGREKAEKNGSLRFGKYEEKEFKLFPIENIQTSPLANTPDKEGDVLFFIHGYNNNLKGVGKTFETLNEKYVGNENSPIKHIVIFTWPGRQSFIPRHYKEDKDDAIASGKTLANNFESVNLFLQQCFFKEKESLNNRKIHLMAHSMGNRVLKNFMTKMTETNAESIPEIFDQIVLVAADVEDDIFEKKNAFNKLTAIGKKVHVYHHRRDWVLFASKWMNKKRARLGFSGKENLENVYALNVSKTKDDKIFNLLENWFNHWYYYTSTSVVDDILNIFKGKESSFIEK